MTLKSNILPSRPSLFDGEWFDKASGQYVELDLAGAFDVELTNLVPANDPWLDCPKLHNFLVGKPPEKTEQINFTDPSVMKVELVPSVELALNGDIKAIDWIEPGTETSTDPFDERFTGNIVVRETRVFHEGPFGPVERDDVFYAYRNDGSDDETWTRVHYYRGMASTAKGHKRRDTVVDRLTLWVGAGATATSGSSTPELIVGAWADTVAVKEAIRSFQDYANPGPLIALMAAVPDPTTLDPDYHTYDIVTQTGILVASPLTAEEKMLLCPCGVVGIPLAAPEIASATSIAGAITQCMTLWVPT